MKRQAVIGGQFGDEGKGLMVDLLSSQADPSNTFVVRYNGGQQAGHTVTNDTGQHVFSNFGAGSFHNIPTYWSEYCSVDPVGIVNELEILTHQFEGLRPELFIDPEAPVTTPFDKYQNQNSDKYLLDGTCGVGVGATFQREEDFYSLQFQDLFFQKIFNRKLEAIESYYGHKISQADLDDFREACNYIVDCNHIYSSDQRVLNDKNIIFEGAQGLMLDQHFGYFPHVTRSNTGTKNIRKILSNVNSEIRRHTPPVDELYLMTRAYQTRHGNGPMTNEHAHFNLVEAEHETNTFNQWQGQFRRSVLDLDQLRYACQRDTLPAFKRFLVVTCMDQLRAPFKFTHSGEMLLFDTRQEFIEGIKTRMHGFNDVYVSYGPKASDVKLFTK